MTANLFYPHLPSQSRCKQCGPQAALASTSRPVGSSRRLRSEGKRSNSSLGSSERSGLGRGMGGREKRAQRRTFLHPRRPECSICWNDDPCHVSSSICLPNLGSQNGVWHVYPGCIFRGNMIPPTPWSPFPAPFQCPTVSHPNSFSLLVFANQLAQLAQLAEPPGDSETGWSQKVEGLAP